MTDRVLIRVLPHPRWNGTAMNVDGVARVPGDEVPMDRASAVYGAAMGWLEIIADIADPVVAVEPTSDRVDTAIPSMMRGGRLGGYDGATR